MATFPGAVKTFTSKSDGSGNKVFASHMNDVQSEVTAIEDVLLNATAPLSLQRVSATALSVSAGSTLTNLSVTGGSTFTGAVSLPAVEAARLELAAVTTAIANNSTTAIAWTVQSFVTNSSAHSTSSNPSQYRFQSTGVFRCDVEIMWSIMDSTIYLVQIEDSSGTRIGGQVVRQRSSGVDNNWTMACGGLKYVDTLAATPWVRVVVQCIGTTNSLVGNIQYTHLDVAKLR